MLSYSILVYKLVEAKYVFANEKLAQNYADSTTMRIAHSSVNLYYQFV